MFVRVIIFITISFLIFSPTILADNIEFESIPSGQHKAILLNISDKIKLNYDKIETLQGICKQETDFFYYDQRVEKQFRRYVTDESVKAPDVLKRTFEGTVIEFKVDLKNDMVRYTLNRPKPPFIRGPDGNKIYMPQSGPVSDTIIRNSSYLIKSIILRLSKDKGVLERRGNKYAIDSPYAGKGFDPRDFFYIGRPAWEFLSMFAEAIGVDGLEIILEKGNSLKGLAYRARLISSGNVKTEYIVVFSEDAGFNPIEMMIYSNEKISSKTTIEYDEIDGISMPTKRHLLQYINGKLSREEKKMLSDININATIPAEIFSDKNCGLNEGDKLVDHTDNKKEYIVKDGEFVEFKEEQVKKKRDRGPDIFEKVSASASLYVVPSSLKLPTKLKCGQKLVFDVHYELPKEGKYARIFARPFTNGKRTPGYSAHRAIRINDENPIGVAECYFFFKKPAKVDEIRITMVDPSNKVLETGTMSVDAQWHEMK